METKTVYTSEFDSYEAGCKLAEKLEDISPEIIFLFACPNYVEDNDLIYGIEDVLDNKDLIIAGYSCDGVINKEDFHVGGVSAIGINSFGKIKWSLTSQSFKNDTIEQASIKTCDELLKKDPSPKVSMVFSTTSHYINNATKKIQEKLNCPIFGGASSDESGDSKNVIFANREIKEKSIAILSMSGDIEFSGGFGFGCIPVGDVGTVTKAKDNIVYEIDNKPASLFISGQLGKEISDADRYILSLASYKDPSDPNSYVFKTFNDINKKDGSLKLFSTIKEGEIVRPSIVSHDNLEVSIEKALETINPDHKIAIIISCVGRKWLMGKNLSMEAQIIAKHMNKNANIVGFPSFGEIGCRKEQKNDEEFSKAQFLNTSIVILTLDIKK